MFFGSLMLFESPLPYMRASLSIIIFVVIAVAAFFIFAVGFAWKAHRRKAATGKRGMVEEVGVARSPLKPEGYVFVHGEIWKAIADEPVEQGEKIVIKEVEHLTLKVTKKK